jgi:hypothetical protein
MASHEVAQMRLPSQYAAVFNVPGTKAHMEWSLIGARGVISPFHMDSEGLVTVAIILRGSKYWILVTQIGDDEDICSADSLKPDWDPFFLNVSNNVDRFHFEAVHLQTGNML